MTKKTTTMILLITLMFVFVMCSDYAWYQYKSGSDLILLWHAYQEVESKKGNAPIDTLSDGIAFIYYVQGAVDARWNSLSVPSTAGTRQLCYMVGKYLDAHPNEWHENGADLVVKALRGAFQQKK
jgi:hypothetical protein